MLLLLALGSALLVYALGPLQQEQAYHAFADSRRLLGVPNAWNVLSNLPFLLVGVLGVAFCLGPARGARHRGWTLFFAAFALVAPGSAWYHWAPDDASLAWDRAPMALGFMALWIGLLAERVSRPLADRLLLPALLLGAASVVAWRLTGDLRAYVWVQFFPLLGIVALLVLYRGSGRGAGLLWLALGCYALAKVAEALDPALYAWSAAWVSGHTLKHLLAAGSGYLLLLRLRRSAPGPG
ncbi:MAG TPA: hypothetical protein VIX81_10915 [Gammaproteobacteria bacterium]